MTGPLRGACTVSVRVANHHDPEYHNVKPRDLRLGDRVLRHHPRDLRTMWVPVTYVHKRKDSTGRTVYNVQVELPASVDPNLMPRTFTVHPSANVRVLTERAR